VVFSLSFEFFSKRFQRLKIVCQRYLENGIDNVFDLSNFPLIFELIDKEMCYAEKTSCMSEAII
jgi:predicted GTPase